MRWMFRLENMRNLNDGPRVRIRWAYALIGQMPYEPIRPQALPQEALDAFGAEGDGYLPIGADWYALAKESKGWNSNGLYDLIDVYRKVTA